MHKQYFKSLDQSQKTNALQREQKSEWACSKAFTKLYEYEASGSKDKKILDQAIKYFFISLQSNRNNEQANLGLAIIYTLLRAHKKALFYTLKTLKLAPEQPKAKRLLHFLKQESATNNNKASENHSIDYQTIDETVPQNAQGEIDYDALYARIEQDIYLQVQLAMNVSPNISSMDQEAFKRIEDIYDHLNQAYTILSRQLNKLDENIETSALRVRMYPMETSLKRLEKKVHAIYHQYLLEENILTLQEEIEDMLEHLEQVTEENTLQSQEQEIEILLDECDLIADQLEELEHQGEDIDFASPDYEQLVQSITQLQEKIETIHAQREQRFREIGPAPNLILSQKTNISIPTEQQKLWADQLHAIFWYDFDLLEALKKINELSPEQALYFDALQKVHLSLKENHFLTKKNALLDELSSQNKQFPHYVRSLILISFVLLIYQEQDLAQYYYQTANQLSPELPQLEPLKSLLFTTEIKTQYA